MQTPKTVLRITEKMPPDFVFVNFEVVREGWNVYKLEDGSLLKTKLVFIDVMAEKDFREKIERAKTEKGVKSGIWFSSSNVVGVEAPLGLRGEPSTRTFSQDELRASVVKNDIDFEVIKETWNVYRLDKGIEVKARSSPINIARTSKFDSKGLPIYLVDSTVSIKVALPKK